MPTEKRDVPAPDRRITDAREVSDKIDGFGLDRAVQAWWAEVAPEIETGRYYAVDGEDGVARQNEAMKRREYARRAWLIDNDYLAGEALSYALRLQERQERQEREDLEDKWYR